MKSIDNSRQKLYTKDSYLPSAETGWLPVQSELGRQVLPAEMRLQTRNRQPEMKFAQSRQDKKSLAANSI